MARRKPLKVIYGGNYDPESRHFEATLMDNVTWNDQVMQQEISDPILPMLVYSDINDVLKKSAAVRNPWRSIFLQKIRNLQKMS
ncbi:aldehyde dehydrogenase family protein [Chryseobacterium fluminis]|uniref:aldehyde dehydrogenase family protein n=1 Tax=Chryseobacterium fluminis TaxID=2983606 RepID=UPI00224E6394|nr:aldehyde dehydrogenase family protein [Chryseobacterium sp. MMS21-Ot14]UZT99427.1 aldehyde dehydrogenase family protein [Chryseobacterium sp. MMS21-Ot14]